MHSVPFPEGMGLSENSATVRDLRDSKRLLHGVLLTQPGVAELVSSLHSNTMYNFHDSTDALKF